jgi:hypothetical protein
MLPLVSDLTSQQGQLLVLFDTVVLEHAARAMPPLLDEDVAEAAAAVAATLETARKGIIYEHHPSSLPAQRLATALKSTIDDLERNSDRSNQLSRDSVIILRRIEQGARTAGQAFPDQTAPAYLSLIRRLNKQLSVSQDQDTEGESLVTGRPQGRGLIVPG